MLIRVLGAIDGFDDGAVVNVGGPNQVRLLAALVAASPRPVSVEELAAQLWAAGDRPVDPVATIRTYVARLRSRLGAGAVVTSSGTYALGPIDTDAQQFVSLVERARRSSGSPTAVALWRRALDLWRGNPFEGAADLDLVRAQAQHLAELRAEAMEAWFDARLAAGEGRELIAELDAAVTELPLREGYRAQQMTALARVGRQADALRAFQGFRAELTDVGLEPSARLVELEQQIAGGGVPSAGARRTLRGYGLGQRIGEGAFAQVWTATQASVGREVAIKQIRSELADQPAFIRRFETEAQLVARLEHPNIVPLYDYWREPGSAYLVMRYVDGGSLGFALRAGPLDLDRVVGIVTQTAAALDAAHRARVIHRDVKPANILLDVDGNAYLSDFGIAVEEQERLDPEAWLSNGSPAYAPPEQLERRSVGPAADVYSLGVTAYEALTAQLPFPGETTMAGLLQRHLHDPIPLIRTQRPEMPAAVDTVLQRATAKNPDDRYQTAGAFAAELAAAAGLEGEAELIGPEDRNPYKGLSPFNEIDAGDFSGRDRLVSRLLRALAGNRLLAVVGPSGSGKSSVVRAGLIPALRQGRLAGSEHWFLTTMTPGPEPFVDLAGALERVAVDPPPDVARLLSSGPQALASTMQRILPEGSELLLVVDQFEELFTLATDGPNSFLDAVVDALTAERSRLRVVLTLRADFYDRPLQHDRFAQLIEESTIAVRPLAADELERAVTEPAAAVGARFEAGLVARITAAVADQPGALPLLQYTLTELFDRRDENRLTLDAYEQLGGVSGAIARRAEECFDAADGETQAAMRRLLGRLVALRDGVDFTRRRVNRSELGGDIAMAAAIDALGGARLLSFDRNPTSREQTVEVAHEALLREWPRLRRWLDEDRDGLRMHRHLTAAADDWHEAGRPRSELYRGGRLDSIEDWAGGNDRRGELNEIEEAFLVESLRQRDAETEQERKRIRRLRRLLTAVAVVAALAMVAGIVAVVQSNRAGDEATRANSEAERANAEADAAEEARLNAEDLAADAQISALLSRSAVEAPNDVDLGLLLAREAANRRNDVDAQRAVLNALSFVPNQERVITEGRLATGQRMGDIIRCYHVTSDNRFMVGMSVLTDVVGESIEIDPASGDVERTPLLERQKCLHFLSPDGRHRIGPGDFEEELTDVARGEVIARFAPCELSLGWAGDGRFVLFLPTEEQTAPVPSCEGPVQLTAIDPDTLAAEPLAPPVMLLGGQRTKFDRWANFGVLEPETGARVSHRWDLETLTKVDETPMQIEFEPTSFDVSDDGELFVVPTFNGPVFLLEPVTGDVVAEVEIPSTTQPFFSRATLHADGQLLVTGTDDGFIRVFDVGTGEEVVPAIANDEGVQEVIWLDPTQIAALMTSGEVRVFDIQSGGLRTDAVACCPGDTGLGFTVRYNEDGSHAAVVRGFRGDESGDVVLVDLVDGTAQTVVVPGAAGAVPRGDGSAVVFTNQVEVSVIQPDGSIEEVGGPPGLVELAINGYGNGQLVVGARGENTGFYIFDLNEPGQWQQIGSDSIAGPLRRSVHPLANGNLLFGRVDGSVVEVDPEDGIVATWQVHDPNQIVFDLSTNGDGLLLTTTAEGRMAVTDLATGEVADRFATNRQAFQAGFGPDGTVVTVDGDGRTRLWDIETQREIGVLHPGAAPLFSRPTVAADGQSVWVGLGADLVQLPIDPDTWISLACEKASRELDEREWEELVPGDEPYRPICG